MKWQKNDQRASLLFMKRIEVKNMMYGNDGMELLPCPFCGGKAELYEQKHREYPSTYFVRCKGNCIKQHDHKSEAKAIEEWNKRV